MPADDTLVFEGTAWPAARISGSARTLFTISVSGHGRRWSTTRPQAFWRSFAEIDLNDAEAVLAFVRRRGDPQGLLGDEVETHTGYWRNLVALLRTAARAWEPANRDGTSHLTSDPQRLREANWFLREADIPLIKNLEPVLDPLGGPGVAFRARTLDTFMAVSAATALERRASMRRCLYCSTWFEAVRKDARFCSGSCRAFHSQKEK